MGHANHFLQRLERASAQQADLALDLYRDPLALKYVLTQAKLPDDTERAAVSLHGEDKGPYLVVTREGEVITCLGEWMGHKGLPLVSYERLQSSLRKIYKVRANLEQISELRQSGQATKLLTGLINKGCDVSREDLLAASVLQPVLRYSFFTKYVDLFIYVDDNLPRLFQIRRAKKKDIPLLLKFWNSFWAMGHFLTLFSTNGPQGMEEFLELVTTKGGFSWALFRHGEISQCLRAIWSVGRIGKPLIASYKRKYLEADSPLTWLEALCALMVLALRHKKYHREIAKTIRRKKSYNDSISCFLRDLPESLLQSIFAPLICPEKCLSVVKGLAKEKLLEFSQKNKLKPPYQYQTIEEVPEDLAMTVLVNMGGNFMDEPALLIHLLVTIPWLAQADIADLYMPQDLLQQTGGKWTPELSLRIARIRKKYYGTSTPRKVKSKPGRNDLCACGSGKKYKRCCALGSAKPKAPVEGEETPEG